MADAPHTTVLKTEAVEALVTDPSGFYVDGTFGRGGHSAEILRRLDDAGRLLALDLDPEALAWGRAHLAGDARLELRHGNFADLASLVADRRPDGILLDLGVSSPQLDDAQRGFSFSSDGPLDMRMDPARGVSAADWLATARPEEMASVLWEYGEERHSRRIARAIAAARDQAPIDTTARLAAIIAGAMPHRERHKHPATRSFQAIRIHVNGELEALDAVLVQARDLLAPGGRLVVISFHSLEDRRVKQFFRGQSRNVGNRRLPPVATAAPLLRRVGGATRPSEAEVAANPRARSAIMRVAEKCRD